jgi:hypothetical protein
MSFSLYDANGYVGDAPSAVALEQLHRYATPNSALAELLDNGFTERLDELTEQLMLSSTPVVDPIIEALKNAEEVLILTDDVPDDEITAAIGNGNNQYRQDRPTKDTPMSSEDASLIRAFTTTGGTYGVINEQLRAGKDLSNDPTVAALDRAFETHGEVAPAVVYRGIAGYEPSELNLEVGGDFTDRGFVSTAKTQKDATKFATNGEMKLEGEQVGLVFKINTHGAKALDLSRFSNYEESESLLPRGTRFKITSIKEGEPGVKLGVVTMSVQESNPRAAIGNGNNQYKKDNPTKDAPTKEEVAAEVREQERLAAYQTSELANPPFVMGGPDMVPTHEINRYLSAYGKDFKPQPLPDDVQRGKMGECYKNASLLVLEREDLDYAEGFARNSSTGDITFMHAWAVDKQGNVIDNTWDHPETNKYFGVVYNRDKYLKSLFKAKKYGVIGSTDSAARAVIQTGGKKLR